MQLASSILFLTWRYCQTREGGRKEGSLESDFLSIIWNKNKNLVVFPPKKGNFKIYNLPSIWRQTQNALREWAACWSPWARQSAVVSGRSPLQEVASELESLPWGNWALAPSPSTTTTRERGPGLLCLCVLLRVRSVRRGQVPWLLPTVQRASLSQCLPREDK